LTTGDKPLSILSCINMLKSLASSVFEKKGKITSNYSYAKAVVGYSYARYSGEKLLTCLKNNLPDAMLFGASTQTKVAVTTCSVETGKSNLCILSSYSSLRNKPPELLLDMTIVEAAQATSAAPTYFHPFDIKNRKLIDGGMQANCPITVALEEAMLIWPNRSFDVCVSVGNNSMMEKTNFNDDVYTFMKITIDLVTSTEKGVNDATSLLKLLKKENAFVRINPKLNKQYTLDASDDISIKEIEQSTKTYFNSAEGKQVLEQACQLLTASLFCCNIEGASTPCEIQGRIFSRLDSSTPQNILKLLKESTFNASLIDSNNISSFIYNWDPDTTTIQFTLKFKQQGFYSLVIKYNELPISGCPLQLQVL